ncbi:hypothetical protein JYP51_17345 [Ponticoccus gilvus]|nr:hypothetical protein [Enemella evansiae]
MKILVRELADLEGFSLIHFAFTLPKDELALDPDHVDGIMLDELNRDDELHLVGLLQYLARNYGHRLGAAIFEPLMESVLERQEEFGEHGIGPDLAEDLREAFEQAVLARYSPLSMAS